LWNCDLQSTQSEEEVKILAGPAAVAGSPEEAARVKEEFVEAWESADITIDRSVF